MEMSKVQETGYLHKRSNDFGKLLEPLMHDKAVTDGAKVLYAHMHWRYGSNCDDHEGRASMSDLLGVSETVITNRVKQLVAKDWIVVIPQRNAYNKTTNFYHVFEVQGDCREWRIKNNVPKPEVEVKERKLRKGVGGKPTHKTKEAEETQVKQATSTQVDLDSKLKLTKVGNSSYHDPDSLDPDSDIQTQSFAPLGANWCAINHKTKQLVVPGQSRALLEVDMSRLDTDWNPVSIENEAEEYRGYVRVSLDEASESPSPKESPEKEKVTSSPPASTRFEDDLHYGVNYKEKLVLVPGVTREKRFIFSDKMTPSWIVVEGKALNSEAMYTNFGTISEEEIFAEVEKMAQAAEDAAEPLVGSSAGDPPAEAFPSAPPKKRWIFPLHEEFAHLVRDANQPTVTLCGIKPLPSYDSMRTADSKHAPCAECLRIVGGGTAPRAPGKDTPLNEAVGLHLQQHEPGYVTMGTKKLAQVIAGYWRAKLKVESLSAEQYEKIARSVQPFVDWYKVECENMHLPTKVESLEQWYPQFAKNYKSKKAEDEERVPHPDIPNVMISRSKYNAIMQDKETSRRLWEQEHPDEAKRAS